MTRLSYIIIWVMILIAPQLASAQNDNINLFDYTCLANGMAFSYQSTIVIQVTFDQVQTTLNTAINQQKNQLIAATSDISLWALKSNELQIHVNTSPDDTKSIVTSSICQTAPAAPSAIYGQAFAIVQVTGVGRAFAFAEVTASGEARAYAGGTGNGVALASAQSTGINPNTSGHVYIVQKGDNLYRIAINHGTTLDVLIQLNNIQDPTAILVGQEIRLP